MLSTLQYLMLNHPPFWNLIVEKQQKQRKDELSHLYFKPFNYVALYEYRSDLMWPHFDRLL